MTFLMLFLFFFCVCVCCITQRKDETLRVCLWEGTVEEKKKKMKGSWKEKPKRWKPNGRRNAKVKQRGENPRLCRYQHKGHWEPKGRECSSSSWNFSVLSDVAWPIREDDWPTPPGVIPVSITPSRQSFSLKFCDQTGNNLGLDETSPISQGHFRNGVYLSFHFLYPFMITYFPTLHKRYVNDFIQDFVCRWIGPQEQCLRPSAGYFWSCCQCWSSYWPAAVWPPLPPLRRKMNLLLQSHSPISGPFTSAGAIK